MRKFRWFAGLFTSLLLACGGEGDGGADNQGRFEVSTSGTGWAYVKVWGCTSTDASGRVTSAVTTQ